MIECLPSVVRSTRWTQFNWIKLKWIESLCGVNSSFCAPPGNTCAKCQQQVLKTLSLLLWKMFSNQSISKTLWNQCWLPLQRTHSHQFKLFFFCLTLNETIKVKLLTKRQCYKRNNKTFWQRFMFMDTMLPAAFLNRLKNALDCALARNK